MDLDYPGAVVSAAQPVIGAWTLGPQWGVDGTGFAHTTGASASSVYQSPLTKGCRYSITWRVDSISTGTAWIGIGSGVNLGNKTVAGTYTDEGTCDTGGSYLALSCSADFVGKVTFISCTNLSRTGVTWRGWGTLAGLSSAQGTASAMPWETTDSAGRRLLRFDGVADYLAQNGLAAIATNKASYTLFSALKLGTFSSATNPYCWGSTGGQYPFRGPLMVSSSQISIRHGISSGNILSSGYVACAHNASHILEETCDGSTLGLSVDGGTPATIDVSGLASFTLSNHTIGGWMIGSTFAAAYPVDTYRVIAIPGVPSAAIRTRIRRILANMYGVTL